MSQTPHIHVDRLITKISTPEIIISVTPKSLQTPPAIKSVRPTKTKQTPTAKKSVRSPKDSILNFLGSRSKQLMEKISPERAPKVTAESVPAVPACTSTVPVTPTDTAPIREHSQSKLDDSLLNVTAEKEGFLVTDTCEKEAEPKSSDVTGPIPMQSLATPRHEHTPILRWSSLDFLIDTAAQALPLTFQNVKYRPPKPSKIPQTSHPHHFAPPGTKPPGCDFSKMANEATIAFPKTKTTAAPAPPEPRKRIRAKKSVSPKSPVKAFHRIGQHTPT